jgi:peroxiredoxin (alkyl hydroperoxide reductase subunit C)
MMQRQVGLPAPSYPLGCVCQIKLERRSNGKLFSRGATAAGLFIDTENGLIRFQMTTDGDVGRNTEEVLHVLQALQSGGPCAANGKPNKK